MLRSKFPTQAEGRRELKEERLPRTSLWVPSAKATIALPEWRKWMVFAQSVELKK